MFQLFETYIASIKNAVGSRQYRNVFAKVDGKKNDITKNGRLSCAVFVSSVLVHFRLLKAVHATVDGTVKELRASGWVKIHKPRIGCVLVWEPIAGTDGAHAHIGFYIGNLTAISNSTAARTPVRHHWTYGTQHQKPRRRIQLMLWHQALE